jgi:hypothetical protein
MNNNNAQVQLPRQLYYPQSAKQFHLGLELQDHLGLIRVVMMFSLRRRRLLLRNHVQMQRMQKQRLKQLLLLWPWLLLVLMRDLQLMQPQRLLQTKRALAARITVH